MAEANVTDLKHRAAAPVNQAGGNTVQEFFEANRGAIEAVLPKHMTPDRLMKIAMQAIRTTPKLKECTTKSLFGAVIQCAEMGLEPNTVLGHAYLVPFNNRRAGTTDVQVIIGWKGLVDLARRSGHITSIQAHAVRAGDKFDYAYGLDERLEHIPAGDESEITHFYAYAKFTDGGYAFEVLPRSKVDGIRDGSQGYQMAKKYGREDHPWIQHYEEMGRKTAIRRLAKFLPLSVEFATAAAMDGQAEAGADQGLDSVLDGDYTVTEPAAEDAPPEVGDDGQTPEGEGSEAPLAEAGGGEQAPPVEPEAPAEPQGVTLEYVTGALRTAKTEDDLADYLDMGRGLSVDQYEEAKKVYRERLEQLQGKSGGGGEEAPRPARGGGQDSGQTKVQKRTPIMEPKAAVTDDAITCLICGSSYKTLTRHIRSRHDMEPEWYRDAFDLPADYPMQAGGVSQGSGEAGGEEAGSEPAAGGEGTGLGERLAQARRQQREQAEGGEPSGESTEEPAGDDSQGGFPNLE